MSSDTSIEHVAAIMTVTFFVGWGLLTIVKFFRIIIAGLRDQARINAVNMSRAKQMMDEHVREKEVEYWHKLQETYDEGENSTGEKRLNE